MWMSEGYHPSSEWNAMCLLSGRKFLLAPWFPRVIHAVLITTVKALCWGSAAPPGPPRFSLWPPWQHRPSAACQPHRGCAGWWESAREWGQGWGCHCFRMKQLHGQFSFLTSYFCQVLTEAFAVQQTTCKETFIDLLKNLTTNLFLPVLIHTLRAWCVLSPYSCIIFSPRATHFFGEEAVSQQANAFKESLW